MEKEALELVESLNNETFIDGIIEWIEPFEFRSSGNECVIYFMDTVIWTSENDEREYESDDEKESLRKYVIRESKNILNDLNKKMNLI